MLGVEFMSFKVMFVNYIYKANAKRIRDRPFSTAFNQLIKKPNKVQLFKFINAYDKGRYEF